MTRNTVPITRNARAVALATSMVALSTLVGCETIRGWFGGGSNESSKPAPVEPTQSNANQRPVERMTVRMPSMATSQETSRSEIGVPAALQPMNRPVLTGSCARSVSPRLPRRSGRPDPGQQHGHGRRDRDGQCLVRPDRSCRRQRCLPRQSAKARRDARARHVRDHRYAPRQRRRGRYEGHALDADHAAAGRCHIRACDGPDAASDFATRDAARGNVDSAAPITN